MAGRYRLLSRIGSGAMGAVWLAQDQLLGREVAVKQVLSTAGMDAGEAADQRARAMREGRIAARLSHPHAITMYDVALDAEEPWLVMEHLPSDSLAAVLATSGVLGVTEVAQIGAQLADALAAAHAAGIVHRDVKPGNVLIGRGARVEGVVKITDFGISRAQGDVTLTQAGFITGTPAYFAPEVARGHDPTGASDVFSLGATLYTALEGVPPFGLDENPMALLHRVARGEIVLPRRAGALTDPLLHALEPDPARRPTMEQVRDDLAAVAAGRAGATTSVLAARTRVLPAGRAAAAVGGAALGGAAAGAAAGQVHPVAARTLLGPPVAPGPAGPPAAGAPVGGGGVPRRTVVAAAVVLAALAAVAAYLLVATGGSPSTAGAAPSTTSTTSTTTDAPTTTTPAAAASSTAEPVGAVPAVVTAAQARAAAEAFFAPLPDDPGAAFALAGPTLKAQGADAFATFWSGFTAVSLHDVGGGGSGGPVTAQLTYTRPDGSTQVEAHELSFVRGPDGSVLLDVDRYVSTVAQTPATAGGTKGKPTKAPGRGGGSGSGGNGG